MKKAILFLIAGIVLLTIVFSKPVEGFQTLMGVDWTSKNQGTPSALYTKLPIEQPETVPVAEAGVGNIEPSPPPPSDLPTSPAGIRSKEVPNPYRNPTNEPAKYIRILGIKEDLQAFFGFEVAQLEEQSDSSIQIPLTRARADLSELLNVQSVMERNPGLPSRVTNKQLLDISSNLSYLRSILRDLQASGVVQEGFVNSESGYDADGPRASEEDLENFLLKLKIELKRLEASGTSDRVVEARINTLQRIKNDIEDVLTKLDKGVYSPETVPIYESDLENALPVLGNPDAPLPKLLQKASLPPAIANLFPGGMSPKDSDQIGEITNLAKGYLDDLFNGSSWGVTVNYKYDNPNIERIEKDTTQRIKEQHSKVPMSTGIPGVHGSVQFNGYDKHEDKQNINSKDYYKTDKGHYKGLPGISNRVYPDPQPGGFDWKERSKQIVKQIEQRGLDPAQFGALPPGVTVSSEFSWRGYTRMLCTRLNASMDPGLGITVGCPSNNWIGWKD